MAASNQTHRQTWMAVLARASRDEIEGLVERLEALPAFEVLKAAETGTVMVEARAGGTGRRFNAGEATMCRCVVRLESGEIGFAYALGRDTVKAELCAAIDAVLQRDPHGPWHAGIHEIASRQSALRELASRKAASTKVAFFTLVRGDA